MIKNIRVMYVNKIAYPLIHKFGKKAINECMASVVITKYNFMDIKSSQMLINYTLPANQVGNLGGSSNDRQVEMVKIVKIIGSYTGTLKWLPKIYLIL